MEQLTALPLPLDEWLRIVEAEYLSGFLPAGGGALKLLIAEATRFDQVTARLSDLAARHRLRFAAIDAAFTRLHMLQDIVFALARALPWPQMVQHYLEDLFARHAYRWPQPGTPMSLSALAEAFGVARDVLAHRVDVWLTDDIWKDRALARDVRAALLRLSLAALDPGDPAQAEPVLAWLRGDKVVANRLGHIEISGRITRTNARAVLVSLCHWVRRSGATGLLVTLDLRALHHPAAAGTGLLRYSPAAVMDTYEVLREIIDDAEHLPGLFVVVLADGAIIAGDPRRALAQYAALQMRLWPDVRPGDRQNPVAPLVWIGA